ncbi:MAG: hypothetical protein AAF417_18930 [Pseudomonadota bacterium]
MRVRTILWPVIASACVLSGSAAMTAASETSALYRAAAVPARAQGEKLPVPRKCGRRFGPIFNFCYSRELFADNVARPSFHQAPSSIKLSA